jgi:hypothetical protein
MSGQWPELQQRFLAGLGADGWRIEEQTIEPLRYLPEQNLVLRYCFRAGNPSSSASQTKRFYLKLYRTRHGEQALRLFQQLTDSATAANHEFALVEPLFYCSERRCLVLAEAPGQSLQDILLRGDDAVSSTRRAARAMAAFSQMQIPTSIIHSAEEQIEFLVRTAELLRWACPELRALIDSLVTRVRARLRDVPSVLIQWDPKPDHVFLADERVTFIDFDDVSLGDPARDPAHMAAHIACRIDLSDVPLHLARFCARALIDEFFAHVPESWREQFDLQYTIAMLECACGIFKRQEPRWLERAKTAIEEAERDWSRESSVPPGAR